MTQRIPQLETERLLIRELVMDDLEAINHVLNDAFGTHVSAEERTPWLRWTVQGYGMFAMLGQPHYGERGIELKATGALIGAVGIVPYIEEFGHIAGFNGRPRSATAEVGLFWGIDPAHQGRGYATEAAKAVIYYLTRYRKLGRIIATTGPDNAASQAVMRKLGMVVHHIPPPAPGHITVVGVLDNLSDWRSTFHAVVRHPSKPKLFLQAWRSGYGAPRVQLPTAVGSAATGTIAAALQKRLGKSVWVTRLLRYERDENRKRVTGVHEVVAEGRLPAGEWVDRARLAALPLREEGMRAVFEAYLLRREAGRVPAKRPSWSQPGWRVGALAWIEAEVARLGERVMAVEQVKHWCLASVLRVRTDGPIYYFKAPVKLALFVDEADFLPRLAARFPSYVPAPVAVDRKRGWLLLPDMGATFSRHTLPATRGEVLRRFATLQRQSAAVVDALLADGCIDRRPTVLASQIEPLLADETAVAGLTAAEMAQLRERVPLLKSLCHRLATYAIPATLTHGDLHGGNAARHEGRIVYIDWTDAAIAHPFMDLLSLHWEENPFERAAVQAAYLAAWEGVETPDRLAEVVELAAVLRPLHHAVSLQHINAGVEAASAATMMAPATYLRKVLVAGEMVIGNW